MKHNVVMRRFRATSTLTELECTLHATSAEEELSALGAAAINVFVFDSVSNFSGKSIFFGAAKGSSSDYAVIARDCVFGDGRCTGVLQVASPLRVEVLAAQVVQVRDVKVFFKLFLLAFGEAVIVGRGLFFLGFDLHFNGLSHSERKSRVQRAAKILRKR